MKRGYSFQRTSAINRLPSSVTPSAYKVAAATPSPVPALNTSFRSRHLYAAGHFARTLAWSFADLTLAYYLHTRFDLSAPRIGQLLALSFIYSSALDLLLAAAFTRIRDQSLLALRLQMLGGLGTAASICLLFFPFPPATGQQGYWLLLACSLMFRTFYALYDVAQNALTSLLPQDDADTARYAALHAAAVPCAKLCIAAAMFAVIGDDPTMPQAVELLICMMIALLIVMTCVPLGLRSRSPRRPPGTRLAHAFPLRLPIMRLLPVLMAVAVEIVLVGAVARLLPFVDHGALLVLALIIGMLMADRGTAWLQRCLGSEARVIVLLSGSGVLGAGALLEMASDAMAMLCAAIHGFTRASTGLIKWRRTALIARHHAHQTGVRADLSCFALLTGTMKLSLGLSSLLVAALLPGIQAQAPDTLATIVVMLVTGNTLSTALLALPGPHP